MFKILETSSLKELKSKQPRLKNLETKLGEILPGLGLKYRKVKEDYYIEDIGENPVIVEGYATGIENFSLELSLNSSLITVRTLEDNLFAIGSEICLKEIYCDNDIIEIFQDCLSKVDY